MFHSISMYCVLNYFYGSSIRDQMQTPLSIPTDPVVILPAVTYQLSMRCKVPQQVLGQATSINTYSILYLTIKTVIMLPGNFAMVIA